MTDIHPELTDGWTGQSNVRIALDELSYPTGQGDAVADLGALTSSQNATTNASAQTGSYVQADAESIRTLANALKVNYNAAQVDIASLRTKLNALLASLRAGDIIDT